MYQLSDEQINIVYERLRREGLKSRKLEQDLFDHFCCYMEEHIDKGESFEEAYSHAVKAISPNGTKEIEFELYFIMNYQKQLSMKRFIFLAGFFATFLVSMGIMFKTMRWPGTAFLLFTGFAILFITVLAIVIHMVRFLQNRPASFWLRTLSGLTSVSLISVGFIFRIFHLPGANVMYVLGMVMLNFLFLPMFFYSLYKDGFVKTTAHETV